MIRRIIHIDSEKCNGCGACASACHEGAIGMVNGKAVLLRDDYCDGLGDCLPTCPTNAISFVEREALPYDEVAVKANMAKKKSGFVCAYGNFHNEFMKNKVTIIGCPKLDDMDYSEKLTEIIKNNNIKSVTVVRMEVPCCGGIENAVKKALMDSGKFIPWSVVTISTDGKILD